MARQFTADYFYTSQGFGAPNELRQATLIDLDLARGNTAGELVTRTGTPGEIFDGFPVLRAGVALSLIPRRGALAGISCR